MSKGRRAKAGGEPRRLPVVALLAWFTVVALGSGLVWAVISQAGKGVVSSAAPVYAGAETQGPVVRPSGSASGHSNPTESPDDKKSKKGSTAKPSAGPTGSAQPSQGQPSGGSSQGGTSGNTSPKPNKSATDAQRRSWNGKAGSVTVSCSGQRIRLIAAQPNVGYRVEVENEGSDELKVKFERSGDGGETLVTALCRGGTAQFRVESGDD